MSGCVRSFIPCIPNAKLANGLVAHSDVFKFGLQILSPPIGEFLVVKVSHSDASVHDWILTEIAQFGTPKKFHIDVQLFLFTAKRAMCVRVCLQTHSLKQTADCGSGSAHLERTPYAPPSFVWVLMYS